MRDSKQTLTTVILVAAAALVDELGRVLVQRRPSGKSMAGLWEFPGGKVEPGETPEVALARELHEELGVFVDHEDLKPITFVSAPLANGHLVMLLYDIRAWNGCPEALHADALLWATPEDLESLPMPPADVPLVAALKMLPSLSAQ